MTAIPFDEVHQQMLEDPVYRQAWAESDLRMQVAFELCDARKRSGLVLTEVASQIGVAEDEVREWERGDGRTPDLDALHRYAEATSSRLRVTLIGWR